MLKKKKKEPKKIDKIIEKRLDGLENYDPNRDKDKVENLSKLVEIKEKTKSPLEKIDLNTVIPVAGSLLGIVIITCHEKLNVLTTKALGFIPKFRI